MITFSELQPVTFKNTKKYLCIGIKCQFFSANLHIQKSAIVPSAALQYLRTATDSLYSQSYFL